jgi:hypothetical protein
VPVKYIVRFWLTKEQAAVLIPSVPPMLAVAKLLIVVPVGKVMITVSLLVIAIVVVIPNFIVYYWFTTIGLSFTSPIKN